MLAPGVTGLEGDFCNRVYMRGAGWVCESTPVPFPADEILRGSLLVLAAVVFLWWCANAGRRDGETHGPFWR